MWDALFGKVPSGPTTRTTTRCGCIVSAIHGHITGIDWCPAHLKELDKAVELHDQWMEDQIFNGELNWNEDE